MWPTLRTLCYSNFEPLPRLGVSKCQKSWNDLPSPSGPTLANSSHWPQWTTHFSALGSTGWGYKNPIFLAPKRSLWSFLIHEILQLKLVIPCWIQLCDGVCERRKNSWMTPLEVFPSHAARGATTVIQNDHFGMLKQSTANARKTLVFSESK